MCVIVVFELLPEHKMDLVKGNEVKQSNYSRTLTISHTQIIPHTLKHAHKQSYKLTHILGQFYPSKCTQAAYSYRSHTVTLAGRPAFRVSYVTHTHKHTLTHTCTHTQTLGRRGQAVNAGVFYLEGTS